MSNTASSTLLFEDAIALSLHLQHDSQEITIHGGNISHLDLHLFLHGFDASIKFYYREDSDLQTLCCDQTLVTATLTLCDVHDSTKKFLTLKGLVTHRSLLREHINYKVRETPILIRHYAIDFHDHAQVLWRHHFPTALYTDKTFQELLDMHKQELILNYDLPPLTVKHPQIALGLGSSPNSASFYDFVIWYLSQHRALLLFDYTAHSYSLTHQHKDSKPLDWSPSYVHNLACRFPEPLRYKSSLLNSYSDNPQTKTFENTHAHASLERQELVTMPVADQFEERGRQQPPHTFQKHALEAAFQQFPNLAMAPGAIITFQNDEWHPKAYYKKEKYRLQQWHLHAATTSPEFLHHEQRTHQHFCATSHALLHLQEDTTVLYPSFTTPLFPFYVEGKVVSEVGSKEEMTYQLSRVEKTSVEYYQVSIPLWEDKKITIEFHPSFNSGQFYFPLCKGERVLVALELLHARLDKVLNWWPRARLPLEQQGNQVVFTPKKEDDYTFLLHTSEKDKSLFKIERLSQKQTQTILLHENDITLELRKEGESQPLCSIVIDAKSGITITNQHKDKESVQKITLDGENVQILCKNSKETSTFLQTPEAMTLKCKKFSLESEEISFTAKKSLKGTSAKELAFNSDENFTITAKKNLSQTAQALKVTAQNALSLTGKSSTLEGQSSLTAKGGQLSINGSKIAIVSSSVADFSGKVVSIKGNMTSIEGSLLKLN